jgi:hypothetical protein
MITDYGREIREKLLGSMKSIGDSIDRLEIEMNEAI